MTLGARTSYALTNGCYTYTVSDNNVTITKLDSSYSGALSIANALGGCPVTGIGDWAVSDCTNLTDVTIPDSVTRIGEKAFSLCGRLTSVRLGNGVTGIGDYAFFNCTGLTSVAIGNGVTRIGNNAFLYCRSLTSVTIPDSVTDIGNSAFRSCDRLSKVTIPGGIANIGSRAFSCCDCLTEVYFKGVPPKTDDGVFESSHTSHVTVYYPAGTPGWEARFADRPAAPPQICHPWSRWWLVLLVPAPFGCWWCFRKSSRRYQRRRECGR